jgi:hypothetical protein
MIDGKIKKEFSKSYEQHRGRERSIVSVILRELLTAKVAEEVRWQEGKDGCEVDIVLCRTNAEKHLNIIALFFKLSVVYSIRQNTAPTDVGLR